jgi:DNA-binding response OmpR family regulator
MTPICPHCGYDLADDEPVETNGVRVDPRGDVTINGTAVHMTPPMRIILASLLKSGGRTLTIAVLAERIGYDGEIPVNNVQVHLSRLRRALKNHGMPNVIGTIHSIGVRWTA